MEGCTTIITEMEEFDNKKKSFGKSKVKDAGIKIYIDGNYAFLLYRSDINRHAIKVGSEISEDTYIKIIEDTVYRRAKQKILFLLKFMDRTEHELRKKLTEALYTEDIIDRTIDYVKEYGYLNDERYATSYIKLRKDSKSRLRIQNDLMAKGINKELLDNLFTSVYSETDDNPELIAIRKAIAKKTSDPSTLSWEEKQKLMASLYRKGFEIDKIKYSLK